jgi:hypothetical protein
LALPPLKPNPVLLFLKAGNGCALHYDLYIGTPLYSGDGLKRLLQQPARQQVSAAEQAPLTAFLPPLRPYAPARYNARSRLSLLFKARLYRSAAGLRLPAAACN